MKKIGQFCPMVTESIYLNQQNIVQRIPLRAPVFESTYLSFYFMIWITYKK